MEHHREGKRQDGTLIEKVDSTLDHYTEKEISKMGYCREGTQQFGNNAGKLGHHVRTLQGGKSKTKQHKKLLIKVWVSVAVFVFLFACFYPLPPPPLVGLWVKPTLTVTATRQLSPLCLHVKLSLRGIPCAPPRRL
jgi:hypothetical protein